MEFSKWYLETDRWLWWKRIFLQLKTENRLSEKLVCDMWIPLTELQLCFVELFSSLITVESETCYFGSLWKLSGQRKYRPLKVRKKLSEKLLCVLWIHLTELHLSPQEAFREDCSCGIWKWYLEAHGGLWWKGKYPQIKTGKKLSEKLLWVLWIHRWELQLSPPEAVRYDCSCGNCKGIFGSQ